ncbi:MAG: carboxypeptidase regulatory-like domain-containing protein [Acidobacteriota bacterium]
MAKRIKPVIWGVGMLILYLFITNMTVNAQTIYGSISGTVRDESGAVIAGAQVTIRNIETGLVRETIANDAGYYRVASLSSGQYSVRISAPNFESIVREPIAVSVAVDAAIDVALKPGNAEEVVTVTGEAPLIEPSQSQLNKGVDQRRILELPGLRSLNGLALLQPGSVPNNNNRPGSGFSINGGRTRSNNFTIDGANNNDQSLSIPRQNLPPEALQEFRIVTNNFAGEYGRNSGAYINVITRSGSNDFHGIFRFTANGNSFDGLSTAQERTFEAARKAGFSKQESLRRARSVVVESLAAFSGGGPIKKDHTFFFVSYDIDRLRSTTSAATRIAISPQGIANLTANANRFAPGALDFLTKTFPTANDPTPRGQIDVRLSGGLVIPVPLQQFNRALGETLAFGTNFSRFLSRIDTKLSGSDNLSVRYLINDSTNPGTPSSIPGQEVGQVQRDQSITINEVHVFSSSLINDFRFTYSRRSIDFPENLPPSFNITGFSNVGNGNFPQFRTDNVYEYTDNISYSLGRHAFKTGVNILRYQLNSFFAPNLRGSVSYPSLTAFLTDQNATFSQFAGDGLVPSRTTELSTFFQDTFRAYPSLTLNLAFRYEYTGAPFGYFSNAKPDINNVAPRFGFAWNPRADNGFLEKLLGTNRTVIRGGYAISYDQVFQNILLNVARNFPRGVNIALGGISGQRIFDTANRPAPPSPQDFVNLGGNPNLLPIRLYSPNKRIGQPYAQQFSLGIEREFLNDYVFKVYYVGTRGLSLVREVERNIGFTAAAVNANPSVYADILPGLQPIRNAQGVITSFRVDPTRGSTLVGDGLAQSIFHSLQLTASKRFNNGLQFEVNYTYSSFINDSDDILGGQTNNTLPAVPFNFKLERARSGFDQPQRLIVNYLYEFPQINKGNGVIGRALSGFQLSGVTTVADGTPFTILNGSNALGILPGQIGTVEGSQRVSLDPTGLPGSPTSSRVPNPFFVFNQANSGIIGTAGRNTERTGGTVNFDMALAKATRVYGESHVIQFRWEVFNVFGRRNFTAIPANTVTADTDLTRFLNLGQTDVAGRTMIFSLRYSF